MAIPSLHQCLNSASYRTSTIIYLSLEVFTNNGLTPEECREVIESMPDPGSCYGARLVCERQYINYNRWNVRTRLTSSRLIDKLHEDIIYALYAKLKSKEPSNASLQTQ